MPRFDRNAANPLRLRRLAQRLARTALTLENMVTGEVPTGAIDSVNDTFVLASVPAGNVVVFLQGVRQVEGTDYTIVDDTILFSTPPTTGDSLVVDYIK